MTNSARLSGRPSSSAAYNVGNVVDTPDSAIKSWRYLGAGEWEPNDAVRYTRGPGGGVEFPGIAPLTAAVRNAVQYIVSHADLNARPPRLWPVDAVDAQLYGCDDDYAYGKTSNAQSVRVNLRTRQIEVMHEFAASSFIADMFVGHGVVLAVVEGPGGLNGLWRSGDQGASYALVHNLGTSYDGTTHNPNVKILMRGLDFGEINGRPAIVFGTYNFANAEAGSVGDQDYIAVSFDNGVTWEKISHWNLTTNTIRHFHVARYDPYRKCFWFCTGDTDAQSGIIRWDGVSAWPADKSPSEMVGTPGFYAMGGRQRYRVVDLCITDEWIYSFTDTVNEYEGGIWRFAPDCTKHHRVNHSVLGKDHEGWSSLKCIDGTMLWCDNAKAGTTGAKRNLSIYASKTGDRWYDIAKASLTGSALVAIPRGFFQSDDGLIWYSADAIAGDSGYRTVVMQLKDMFREKIQDNIAPVYFVDPVNGSDAADGRTKNSPWKTVSSALAGDKITHGARIVVSEGAGVESSLTTLQYAANAVPATDTTASVQITGEGKSETILSFSSGSGWYNTLAAAPAISIMLEDLTLRPATGQSLLWCGSAVVNSQNWVLRNAEIGGLTNTGAYVLYTLSAACKITAIRSDILTRSDAASYTFRADNGGTINIQSCRVIGGRGAVDKDGALSAKHCHFDFTANYAVQCAATSTVQPAVKNCTFGSNGVFAYIRNDTANYTLSLTNVAGNAFSMTPHASDPSSALPPASGLDHDPETLVPFAWSALAGIAEPVGVEWDYYGNPFRARPAIGAVEIPPEN